MTPGGNIFYIIVISSQSEGSIWQTIAVFATLYSTLFFHSITIQNSVKYQFRECVKHYPILTEKYVEIFLDYCMPTISIP